MTGIELKEIIVDQNRLKIRDNIIEREVMRSFREFHDNPFIVAITGIRRCGKSTFLKQVMGEYPGYYLNFDDDRLINFQVDDFQKLVEIFHELYGERLYYYLDEIQNIKGWELFARRLRDEDKKLYVTGSNANMLSKELGTRLTGRYLQWNLYPFSFREYVRFNDLLTEFEHYTSEIKGKIKAAFNQYLLNGGFPEYLFTGNIEYLRTLYNNIIYRDVLARYNITNDKIVKELMYHIASNLAKEFSYNSLKNMLKLGSSTTIKDYLNYIENSYLLIQVPKFSYSTKSQIYANKKIYMIDTAMAVINGFRLSGDMGRLLENLVCIHLKRNNHELFYFRDKYECDFIAGSDSGYYAIQVCYELHEMNRERELRGLAEAMNKLELHNGTIITIDQEEEVIVDGKEVSIIPAYKWLWG